jgi:putative Mg2+ transporter-C (MgtC) family protein
MFEAATGLYPDARMDPLRAVEGVIAAVGFLGGGLILRTDGGRVRGLTTAANLWASGIVGLAYGTGLFVLGLMITVLGVMVTAGLGALEQRETEDAARDSPHDRAQGGRN